MARDLPRDLHAGGFAYIRARYDVPVRRMGSVTYRGEPGVVTDADGYLTIRLNSRLYKGSRIIVHPNDPELVYLPQQKASGGDGG